MCVDSKSGWEAWLLKIYLFNFLLTCSSPREFMITVSLHGSCRQTPCSILYPRSFLNKVTRRRCKNNALWKAPPEISLQSNIVAVHYRQARCSRSIIANLNLNIWVSTLSCSGCRQVDLRPSVAFAKLDFFKTVDFKAWSLSGWEIRIHVMLVVNKSEKARKLL